MLNLKIGQIERITKTITKNDILAYAKITEDFNPIHINKKYSKKTIFKRRISHGLLVAGLISSTISNKISIGAIYLKQDLKFIAPVYINDTVTAIVEIKEILINKKQLILKTTCVNQHNKIVITGEALIKI